MELRDLRILVLDDRPDTLEIFSELLTLLGAQTCIASTAHVALQMLGSFLPHVVISDLEMPGKDGYEFLADLRAAGETVPVIASTGYTTAYHEARASAAGFAAFLPKPASLDSIAQTVLRVLGRGQPESA